MLFSSVLEHAGGLAFDKGARLIVLGLDRVCIILIETLEIDPFENGEVDVVGKGDVADNGVHFEGFAIETEPEDRGLVHRVLAVEFENFFCEAFGLE